MRRSILGAVVLVPFLIACGGDDDPTGPGDDDPSDGAAEAAAVGTRFHATEPGTVLSMEEVSYYTSGQELNGTGTISDPMVDLEVHVHTIVAGDDLDSIVVDYTVDAGSLVMERVSGTIDTASSEIGRDWTDITVDESYTMTTGDELSFTLRSP